MDVLYDSPWRRAGGEESITAGRWNKHTKRAYLFINRLILLDKTSASAYYMRGDLD